MKNRQTGKCRQTVCCVATMQTKVFLRSVRCEPRLRGGGRAQGPTELGAKQGFFPQAHARGAAGFFPICSDRERDLEQGNKVTSGCVLLHQGQEVV